MYDACTCTIVGIFSCLLLIQVGHLSLGTCKPLRRSLDRITDQDTHTVFSIYLQVEQLSHQTGEESVLLTASISDGTLSHLGSESGKIFLDRFDDFKSQFLGFCIKSKSLPSCISSIRYCTIKK